MTATSGPGSQVPQGHHLTATPLASPYTENCVSFPLPAPSSSLPGSVPTPEASEICPLPELCLTTAQCLPTKCALSPLCCRVPGTFNNSSNSLTPRQKASSPLLRTEQAGQEKGEALHTPWSESGHFTVDYTVRQDKYSVQNHGALVSPAWQPGVHSLIS